MWTTVLAYVLAFVGVMTFGAGGLAFLWLMFEEVTGPGHVPLRHYAVVAGLISAGLSTCITMAAMATTHWGVTLTPIKSMAARVTTSCWAVLLLRRVSTRS